MIKRLIILPLLLLLVSCFGDEGEEERVMVGDPVPAFVVTLNDGSTYDSRQRDGRGALIVFFNTACADCRRELPRLNAAYERGEYADRHVVCIARQEADETIRAFWNELGLTLPYSPQPDRAIFSLFASAGIPRVYTVNPDGRIVHLDADALWKQ